MKKVFSQPSTKDREVVNSVVVQSEPVKSARVEDRLRAPLSLTRVTVTGDSSDYDNTETEEVLAELAEQLEVFPPTKKLRGGRSEGCGEVHCEGAEGHQVQGRVLGGQED
jgi:hypothetical protein